MPFERWRYPADWRTISLQNAAHPITGARVVLTVAHLNHTPMDCRDENLLALCQRCHLNYDRPRHVAKAKAGRRARRAAGDLFSGPYTFGLDRRRARG